jgi:hypothetical protein
LVSYRKRIPRQLRAAFEGKHEKEVEARLPQLRSDAMLVPTGEHGSVPLGATVIVAIPQEVTAAPTHLA